MRILRRFYPQFYPCPRCKSLKSEMYSHKKNLQHRRCGDCGCEFKVPPSCFEIREHEDGPSRIVFQLPGTAAVP